MDGWMDGSVGREDLVFFGLFLENYSIYYPNFF